MMMAGFQLAALVFGSWNCARWLTAIVKLSSHNFEFWTKFAVPKNKLVHVVTFFSQVGKVILYVWLASASLVGLVRVRVRISGWASQRQSRVGHAFSMQHAECCKTCRWIRSVLYLPNTRARTASTLLRRIHAKTLLLVTPAFVSAQRKGLWDSLQHLNMKASL